MEEQYYENSGIDERLLRAIKEMGFTSMTPIQAQAIPALLEGRDVIGQAQTGTGKTAAFGLPMLQRIDPEQKYLQGIILCPTRELAIQAAEEMRRFAKYTHNIKILPVYGGQDISKQIRGLKGTQIVVGTPGRVMDHMRRHTLKLDQVSMVVLDEADEMLNMGFREDMETILKEVPENRQSALFSATMPQAILEITGQYQKDAVMIRVTPKELTIPLVSQYYYVIRQSCKTEALIRLLEYYSLNRILIFCNTKKMVDDLSAALQARGYCAEGLHGDMTQNQRDSAMGRFRGGSLHILIATDVAARGIDVDDVEAVFNYDIPQDIEYYVHRIGRTGRAGKEGMSFTLVSPRETYKIREIERSCHTKMAEHSIPTAAETTQKKAEKILDQAITVLESGKSQKFLPIVERKLEELGISASDLAAAFLKLNLGEEQKEISMEPPVPTSQRRAHGRGRFEKTFLGEKRFPRKQQDGKKQRSAKKQWDTGKPLDVKNRQTSRNGQPSKTRITSQRREASHRQLKRALKDIRQNGQPYFRKNNNRG